MSDVKLIPIARNLPEILRNEARDARNGDMIVRGIDIDMAELLEDAATEIEHLRSRLRKLTKTEPTL